MLVRNTDKKNHSKTRIKEKKPKQIEEPERPVKKKNKNKRRWHNKKDPSSTSSSPAPEKASEVDQKEAPPLKEETPWPCKGKSFIYYIFIALLVVASHV